MTSPLPHPTRENPVTINVWWCSCSGGGWHADSSLAGERFDLDVFEVAKDALVRAMLAAGYNPNPGCNP